MAKIKQTLLIAIFIYSSNIQGQIVTKCDTMTFWAYNDYCENFVLGCVSMNSKYFDSLSYNQIRGIPTVGCEDCPEVEFKTQSFKIGNHIKSQKYYSFQEFTCSVFGNEIEIEYNMSPLKIKPRNDTIFILNNPKNLDYKVEYELYIDSKISKNIKIDPKTIAQIEIKNLSIIFKQESRCFNQVEFPNLIFDINNGY